MHKNARKRQSHAQYVTNMVFHDPSYSRTLTISAQKRRFPAPTLGTVVTGKESGGSSGVII